MDLAPEVRIENEESTEILFPNSYSLASEPFIVDIHEEEEKGEQVEHIEPPATPSLSNDKEMSIVPSSQSLLRHSMNPKLH